MIRPALQRPKTLPTGHAGGTKSPIVVIGIGADGWDGLVPAARTAIREAPLVVGSARQLELLPSGIDAELRPWPSPIDGLVDELVTGATGPACVLASGDPMLHGIGATIARRVEPARLTVHPHVSAFALACARLGWPASETELVNAIARPLDVIARWLQPGRRIVVYVARREGARELAGVVCSRGFGPSRFVLLEQLGAADERIVERTAETWGDRAADALHSIAIECRPGPRAPILPCAPGLPDEVFEHDGQLTKREIRAVTLAALAPLPGQLLWDLGAGAGSVAIEWLRAEKTARAVAVERDRERAERIRRNAAELGVPELTVRYTTIASALPLLEQSCPDAIFIGGGLSEPDLVRRCWRALEPGGRLVANAVSLEGERVLLDAHASHGGRLLQLAISRAEPLGGYTTWRPQRPLVQWAATKEAA